MPRATSPPRDCTTPSERVGGLATSRRAAPEKLGVGRLAKVVSVADRNRRQGGELGAPLDPAAAGRAQALVQRFHASLRDETPTPVSAESGRRSVMLLDEIWRALGPARTGGPS